MEFLYLLILYLSRYPHPFVVSVTAVEASWFGRIRCRPVVVPHRYHSWIDYIFGGLVKENAGRSSVHNLLGIPWDMISVEYDTSRI